MATIKRYVLAVAITALALPASALAAPAGGLVLSVDSRHHTIQVVDSRHVVREYNYRGALPRLQTGSQIGFQRSRNTIARVKAISSKLQSVAYYARVVSSSSHGLVLRLADGATVSFSSHQITHRRARPSKRHRPLAHADFGVKSSAGITVNVQGLEPGVTILVTETVDSNGNITVTITLPPSTASAGSGGSAEQQAGGVVTEVDNDAFNLQTADGSELRLHMAQDALANLGLQGCDTVDVTYHQDAGMLIADNVQSTGTSSTGDCAAGPDPQDAVGTIAAVSADAVTISSDQGALTFNVDPTSGVTDGFIVGDLVDVTYTANGAGILRATDVEYVEQDATGTVTAVSGSTVTITDDSTGQPDTFAADPSLGMFDGVAIGDHVDVTYHQSSGTLTADTISDPA